MYSFISKLSTRDLVFRQAPSLGGALIFTELFCKWHSFALEAGGFLALWYVLDAAMGLVAYRKGPEASQSPS